MVTKIIQNGSKALKLDLVNLPAHVVTGATDIVTQVTNYLTFAQQEKTKRADITARRDVAIAEIQKQREVLLHAIDRTFQERAAVLQGQLDALEFAVKAGNVEIVALSLQSMVHVIQTSPFNNFNEVKKLLTDKDSVLRLD
jgi:hypothetical protein